MLFWSVLGRHCTYNPYTLFGSLFLRQLATLENELCPGCAPSVPHALDLPEVPLKLTTLAEPAWTHYRILLVPSYNGLHRFRAGCQLFTT